MTSTSNHVTNLARDGLVARDQELRISQFGSNAGAMMRAAGHMRAGSNGLVGDATAGESTGGDATAASRATTLPSLTFKFCTSAEPLPPRDDTADANVGGGLMATGARGNEMEGDVRELTEAAVEMATGLYLKAAAAREAASEEGGVPALSVAATNLMMQGVQQVCNRVPLGAVFKPSQIVHRSRVVHSATMQPFKRLMKETRHRLPAATI